MPLIFCTSERRARPRLLVRSPERHHPYVSTYCCFLNGPLISLLSSCQDFDERLIKLVWRNRPMGLQSREPSMHSMVAHSDPFGSQAAIMPTDPSTVPGTPSLTETKEKDGEPS